MGGRMAGPRKRARVVSENRRKIGAPGSGRSDMGGSLVMDLGEAWPSRHGAHRRNSPRPGLARLLWDIGSVRNSRGSRKCQSFEQLLWHGSFSPSGPPIDLAMAPNRAEP